ncbi:hypothetical protein BX666DRAFT_2026205 [Dichotomocladium elegans]|nr:hypothetical protein BX666DRAFT_2026205 [Dichotomocladium elegans]
MNIVAPCPKKPSTFALCNDVHPSTNVTAALTAMDEDDACKELQQILSSHQQQFNYGQEEIARTANPLPLDSSFSIVPLHHWQIERSSKHRPRSYSVGDPGIPMSMAY